jgi:uncharacterized protein (TIGR02246 family)
MSKAKLQAATLGGSADDIEAAYYEALQHGDIDRLMACWSDDDEVMCVHPGGPRLVGTAQIRASFEALFATGRLHVQPERVRKIESMASAVHNVIERVEVMTEAGQREGFTTATNVYHKTPQGWRLVAHHASPGTRSEMQEASAAPVVLH